MIQQRESLREVKPIKSRNLDSVKTQAVKWHWPGFLPRGMVAILEGRKGSGKSSVAAAIAAAMTGGPPLPGQKKTKAQRVCWLSNEEDYRISIAPRLKSAGAKLQHCCYPESEEHKDEPRRILMPSDTPLIADYIREQDIRLLVLDPLSSFIDSSISLSDEQNTRQTLEPLVRMARVYDCTILLIRHVRKSSVGPALDAGLGSVAIGNVSRIVLRTFQNVDDKSKHFLAVVGSNIAEIPPTVSFETVSKKTGHCIRWGGTTTRSADDLSETTSDTVERSALLDAIEVLKAELSGEGQPAEKLKSLAEKMGISPRTLRRAKMTLNIASKQIKTDSGRQWLWVRPEKWPAE